MATDRSDPLTVRARDVLFAHWPVDPDALTPHVPDPLSVATRDGHAWLGAVALETTDVRLGPVPDASTPFLQVNLRTYVRHGDDLGVYFLSLDCGNRAAAAAGRTVWRLPFFAARGRVDRRGGRVTYRSRRRPLQPGGRSGPGSGSGSTPRSGSDSGSAPRSDARFDARFAPTGDPAPLDPDSLAGFLIERHRYFVPTATDLLVGEIERDPWQVSSVDAEIRTNSLPAAAGLDLDLGPVHVHYSPEFESRTGRASRTR